ncbi:MFS general substrate transporter [Meira miltonrushii]|uniref:MFS general substrate transporter n=1 Tax=Meira miltonrushii TaxID=1280837 RepID=A0A316V983_9BASI|nr:MFS general substrate transporter [Meira miltonrushii]PWN34086.1 MFS general substrate transporter [Meira miltonrushii]
MSASTDPDQEEYQHQPIRSPDSPRIDSPSSSNSSQDHLLGAFSDQRSIKMMQRSDSYKSKKDGSSEGEERSEPGTRNAAGGQLWTGVAPVPDTDRVSRDSDLSLSDLFDPQRTAKENKSLLMSYELDRMEMGRYQWCIFGLCGLGYFIDLLWAQALGLIAVPLKNEPTFEASDTNIATLSTAFNVGLTVGAFTWGILVDVVGRRWSFYLTCLFSGVFGIATGGSNSFLTLRILTAFVGFGVGGNIPIDTTITLEALPTRRRFLLVLLSLFQPVGVLVASGIAYGFIPTYSCASGSADISGNAAAEASCTSHENRGWRYYLFTLGAITMGIFLLRFLVFTFHESPAFLINQRRDEEAIAVVKRIAKTNKAPQPQFTIQDFQEIDRRCAELHGGSEDSDEDDLVSPGNGGSVRRETYLQSFRRASRTFVTQFKNLRILFRSPIMARATILLWLTYMADFWGFNIAGFFLPQILAARGAAAKVPLSETYRDYVAIYAPGIVACLLGGLLIEIPRLGRQWSMVIASALMAVSMFLYTIVDSQAASVGLNVLEYFMQSLFNAILYAYTPEVYPSAIRGTAAGFTSTLGRVAGIVAPLAGGALFGGGGDTPEDKIQAYKNVLYLGGGVTLLCPVALALLPFETRGVRSY